MPNTTVVLYLSTKIEKKWTFRKAPESRLRRLSEGAYYISWYEGARKLMEKVGREPDAAQIAKRKKEAELNYAAVGGVTTTPEPAREKRRKLSAAVHEYLEECRDRQGKSGYGLARTTVEAYRHRLSYLLEFSPDAYLDQVNLEFAKAYRKFLLQHNHDLTDRTCYNFMQAASTFLVRNDIHCAKKVLKEMSFPPKPVIPYTTEGLAAFFAACNFEAEKIFKFFLHSMCREREVAFCETRDLLFDKNVLHVSPKPDKSFRLKGKRTGQARYGRKVPINSTFMAVMKDHCDGKAPRDLVFPNDEGGIQNHYLRLCKKIAKRAGLKDWNEWDLHRWRKTGATRHHESGVSVRKIQAWLGHQSLDVTLDYLGVEDAADEASQEQVNNGALAVFA